MTISSNTLTIRGKLGFNHLVEPDAFKGSKPKYKVRITNLSDAAVAAINERFGEDAGMGHKRVKFDEKYPDSGQYAGFSSYYPIKVTHEGETIITKGTDGNGNDVARVLDPIATKIGRGSDIVIKLFADGNGNPRISFIDIVDLVTFGDGESEEDSYNLDEVL